jgi:hypothetical protein
MGGYEVLSENKNRSEGFREFLTLERDLLRVNAR